MQSLDQIDPSNNTDFPLHKPMEISTSALELCVLPKNMMSCHNLNCLVSWILCSSVRGTVSQFSLS